MVFRGETGLHDIWAAPQGLGRHYPDIVCSADDQQGLPTAMEIWSIKPSNLIKLLIQHISCFHVDNLFWVPLFSSDDIIHSIKEENTEKIDCLFSTKLCSIQWSNLFVLRSSHQKCPRDKDSCISVSIIILTLASGQHQHIVPNPSISIWILCSPGP